ncbi:MAG: cache domain-containing protein, partial [Sulfurimonas sp.]|uniref:cache domain-containing protein n=1 Tax=Sulfurimonas sp. TaxID=2022749 RepID=UPI003D1280A3
MKKMSLRFQMIALSVFSLLILAVITTYIAVTDSKEAIHNKSVAALQGARDIKKSQLETFFKERIGDINILSASADVQELVEDMLHVHDELGVGDKDLFPVANETVREKTKRHEAFFQSYMKEYGYYDIFVICAKHGHVLYSGAKESDYGENLSAGKLKESGLAEAYRKALQNNRPTFIDMSPYAPSGGAPAMFLATPVKVGGEVKAVIVLQVSDAAISRVMQYRTSYGETQEDFLVGQDKLMRSDSFLWKDTHSIKASFANPSAGKVDTEASQKGLSGESGETVIKGFTGEMVAVAYSFVEIGSDLKWAIISRITVDEMEKVAIETRNLLIISSLIVLVIIVLAAVLLINKSVSAPLEKFKTTLWG